MFESAKNVSKKIPGGDEIFRPFWPALGPTHLYNGYRVFPGDEVRPGRAADHLPPSSNRGHGRVELYLYPPSGPHRACDGITLRFTLMSVWKRQVWLHILVLTIIFCSWNVKSYTCSLEKCITFWLEWMNGFTDSKWKRFKISVFVYTFTLNSSVKILVAWYEYVSIKHVNDCGYVKMETYLAIRLLVEMIFLSMKPKRCRQLHTVNCSSCTLI